MLGEVARIEISATAVAWYGAIVATLGLTVTVLNFFRDRSKIKVKVSQGLFVYKQGIGGERQIIIEAINRGRRTVTVTSVGLSLSDGNKLVITEHMNFRFPFEIQEGKAIQAFIDVNDVKSAIGKQGTRVTNAWYQDATGKIYRSRWSSKLTL